MEKQKLIDHEKKIERLIITFLIQNRIEFSIEKAVLISEFKK